MANLMEHMMINKWDEEIGSAITHVGGDTYSSEGLPDYAEIIRTQLVANDAVGRGIYQDFLYVDQDNQTSINPWEGEPTTSTNAPQSSIIATTIKNLYDVMASTERYTVLLVDDFPKGEINLSAVYLVRSKCEECEEECTCKENTYTGCYYIKRGKELVRVDIPEFTYDLNELFYLTRAEYDASLSDYVKEIEDLLRKKFGKYWDDEGFTLDTAVEEIKKDLEEISAQIVADTNARLEAALATVDEAITNAETRLNEKFENLTGEVGATIDELHKDMVAIEERVTKAEEDIVEKFGELSVEFTRLETELNQNVTDNFNTLKSELDTKAEEIDSRISTMESTVESIEERVTKAEEDIVEKFGDLDSRFETLKTEVNTSTEEKFNTLKSEVNERVSKVESDIVVVSDRMDQVESEVEIKFEELDAQFETLKTEVNTSTEEKFEALKSEVQKDIKNIDEKVDTNFNSIMTSLQDYVKIEDLIAIDTEIEELK